MASPSGARLAGDDYQHLLAWMYLLELMLPWRRLESVAIEDAGAGSVDDITLEHEAGAPEPDLFLQVKYHVDHRGQYSTDALLGSSGGRSLLQKFFSTWRSLRDRRHRPFELRLVSNWGWAAEGALGQVVKGRAGAVDGRFFSAPPGSDIGRARARWREHLAPSDEAEFRDFVGTLRFWVAFDNVSALENSVEERMRNCGLRGDRAAVLTGVGIVRNLVQTGRRRLRKADVESLIAEHDLKLPPDEESAATVYLSTIEEQRFDFPPDLHLDWRHCFAGGEEKKGHRALDPASWNEEMLPDLLRLKKHLNESSPARLIRARGLARLSAWFAFGYVFSDVARYVIEVDQQGELWRTDTPPSSLAVVEASRHRIPGGDPQTVAVGVSVSGDLARDVRQDLRETKAAGTVLFLAADREVGRGCLASAGDAVALARGAKARMRVFARAKDARRLRLYYFGPLSGACFLGHQMNAVAGEIQVMEDQQPGYAPSFLLT
jgi:hypothetical protein